VRNLALWHKRETRAIGIRLIGVCGGKSFILVEIAISDFPEPLEPLITTGQVARDSGKSGFGIRDFPVQRNCDL
jgi:hypothetical protein